MAAVKPKVETVAEEAVVEPVKNVPAAVEEDLYAGFTDEERAELLGLTGQAANLSFDRMPTLKINQISSDVQDSVLEGERVKMGNFVLNQITKKVGDDVTIEQIGEDFGPSPEITILKVAKQYFFWGGSTDKMCMSQLLLEPGERPVGSRYGFDCADKSCPKRNLEKDGCKCQIQAYSEVGPEHKQAMYTAKGNSFIPFDTFLKKAAEEKKPLFFYPTKLTTVKKTQGTNTYWVITPVMQEATYAPEEKRRLFGEANKLDESIRGNKEQRKVSQELKAAEARKQLPPGMSVESPFQGGSKVSGAGSAGIGAGAEIDDADIIF